MDGGAIGAGTLAGRGYIDVMIPDGPSGAVLNLTTVTDLAAEFRIDDEFSATVHLDNTQAPVLVSGSTFRYWLDRKSTRLNSSHSQISYAVFCLKNKTATSHL